MAETKNINEVIERVQARVANSQHAVGTAMIDTADALALIAELRKLQSFDAWSLMDYERDQAELESVRKERDELRAAHEIALDGLTQAKAELMSYKAGYSRLEAEIRDLRTTAESVVNAALSESQPAPRRMRIATGYNAWFSNGGERPFTFKEGDIVIAGETDRNGTHVRNLEDNAGALIPAKYLAPIESEG